MPYRRDGAQQLVVEQESLGLLALHARISIEFTVDAVLEPRLIGAAGLGGISLSERAVDEPWRRDDEVVNGHAPTDWPERFDVAHWGLLGAYLDHERVGGAVIAYRTPGLQMLGGQDDLAVIWDLRVAPGARRKGVGAALFRSTEEWARSRAVGGLRVETQNVNVAACRFYAAMGCSLSAIDLDAYPGRPDEVRLLWCRSLTPGPPAAPTAACGTPAAAPRGS